jgi:hypothetical protein
MAGTTEDARARVPGGVYGCTYTVDLVVIRNGNYGKTFTGGRVDYGSTRHRAVSNVVGRGEGVDVQVGTKEACAGWLGENVVEDRHWAGVVGASENWKAVFVRGDSVCVVDRLIVSRSVPSSSGA